MNLVQTATNSGPSSPVTEQQATFTGQVTIGNLLVIIGTFVDFTTSPTPIGVVPVVTDTGGNVYTIGSIPFRNGLNQDWWMQYCVIPFTQSLTVAANYSSGVISGGIGVMEFSTPNGWIDPPSLDGFSAANTGLTGSTPINSGPVSTTNADDLILAMVTYSQVGLALSTGWSLGAMPRLGVSSAWIEQPSTGSIGFTATQGGGATGIWSAAIWAFQASTTAPSSLTFNLITASINPTQFQEAYPNRIPEDIYDSLANNPNLIFSPYGPSPLNV